MGLFSSDEQPSWSYVYGETDKLNKHIKELREQLAAANECIETIFYYNGSGCSERIDDAIAEYKKACK